jgi:predicted nucleic acid-binding protein
VGVLIDSTVLINLERRTLSPSALRIEDDEPWAVSAVTVSELLFGLERAATGQQRGRRRRFVEAALAAFPVLPFDLAVATIHARIWVDLVSRGERIGAHDFMIAATALAHDYTVLTDNFGEFQRIPGLTVRTPAW